MSSREGVVVEAEGDRVEWTDGIEIDGVGEGTVYIGRSKSRSGSRYRKIEWERGRKAGAVGLID